MEPLEILKELLNINWHAVCATVPIRVDMKVQAAIAGFLYGLRYRAFDLHLYLKPLQVMYGVCHPCKYYCAMIYKKFMPIVTVLQILNVLWSYCS